MWFLYALMIFSKMSKEENSYVVNQDTPQHFIRRVKVY